MEFSKQEMKLFLRLPGLWLKNFFYKMFLIWSNVFKINFHNRKLTYLDLSWPILTHLDLSWPVLTYLDLSWPILTFVDLSWPIFTYIDKSWPILTYIELSWPILIYLDLKEGFIAFAWWCLLEQNTLIFQTAVLLLSVSIR